MGRNQERVDLTVELRAERSRCAGPPGHPAVNCIQHQRHGRKRYDGWDGGAVVEGLRDQCRDADGKRGPEQGHPVGRGQVICAVGGKAAGEDAANDYCAGQPSGPTGAIQADRQPQRG